MESADDPDYRQLRREFLDYLNRFHSAHEYTLNWRGLCDTLGITVQASAINQYVRLGGKPYIYFKANDPINRQLFSCLHELSHYLFEEEGFRAELGEKHLPEMSRKLEEKLVDEAAATLLIPGHVLEAAVKQHGYYPESVFCISERAGSLATCLMRLLLAHDVEARGLIMQNGGLVEFSCMNAKMYPLGYGHRIDNGHRIHDAWNGLIELKVPLPYRSGKCNVHHLMRASANGRRVVALFAKAFPTVNNERQPMLGFGSF